MEAKGEHLELSALLPLRFEKGVRLGLPLTHLSAPSEPLAEEDSYGSLVSDVSWVPNVNYIMVDIKHHTTASGSHISRVVNS